MTRTRLRLAVAIGLAVCGLAVVLQGTRAQQITVRIPPDLNEVCGTLPEGGRAPGGPSTNPYLAAATYNVAMYAGRSFDFALAVMAFRDTPADSPQYGLAYWRDVGSVWGLAYRHADRSLYAASFHKRYIGFGIGGPGAIYRIGLAPSGASPTMPSVTVPITVPNAGSDRHTPPVPGPDDGARDWAGKTSLGDIDVSADDTELYAVNLADRRIYRFALPSGQLLGSFDHGAAGADWEADARPFALKYREGRLYHGLVNSAESSQSIADLSGYVYSSAPDGSDMRLEASIPLDYPRGSIFATPLITQSGVVEVDLDWLPWRGGYSRRAAAGQAVYPQPIVADIEFDRAGNMIVGLRDRQTDMTVFQQFMDATRIEKPGLGTGDVIRLERRPRGWEAPRSDFFTQVTSLGDRSALGGLAQLRLTDQVVAGGIGLREVPGPRLVVSLATWYDNPSGNRLAREDIQVGQQPLPPVPPVSVLSPQHNEWWPVADLGDLELICGEDEPPPTPSPTVPAPTTTATAPRTPSPGATPSPSRTPSPSVTPTREPYRVYLPLALRHEECRAHADVALVLDMSTSMLRRTSGGRTKYEAAIDAARQFVEILDLGGNRFGERDQVGIASFNDEAWLELPLASDRAAILRTLDAVPRRIQEGTRLDLAIERGQDVLDGPSRRGGNQPVMILLTDGLPNRVPFPPGGRQEDTVLAAAAAAKAKGTTVFTVGLGTQDDIGAFQWLLANVATTPAGYFYDPDGEDLAAIYRQIARQLPCPGTDPWPPGGWRDGSVAGRAGRLGAGTGPGERPSRQRAGGMTLAGRAERLP